MYLKICLFFLQLEDSQTCQKFDFLKIESKVGYNRQHVTLCGQEPSRQVSLKIDGTEVKMIFHSDPSFAERGFKISYRAYGWYIKYYISSKIYRGRVSI